MIGKTFGHYQVIGRIGKGGMGEVYRARDTRLDRDVALKLIPEELASDPERIARFEREAKAVAALQHPNIVTIHAVENIDGRACIVMELVDGKTLAELIPPGGMTLDRFFEIAIPLSDALRAAHARGVTHRDLKPSNIMVDNEGRLRVLDFGLAKLLAAPEPGGETTMATENVTAEGKILGTVNYMSPEQAEAKALDHRSDIFSLGILLYEMATGVRPFRGDTPISTVSSILKEKPASVTDVRANLPRHLGRVIGRCLEKNPEKRFQTARDVCNELEGLQKEVESGDVEPSLSSVSMSRSSIGMDAPRRRAPWIPIVAGAVVVVLVASYFLFLRKPGTTTASNMKSRPMTGSVGVESPGSWSPDGSFFAYSHSQAGPTDIFVVATAGGDPIRLVTSPADDISPRWSPDSRWIAFASGRDNRSGIYLVPPLGGAVQKLTETGAGPLSQFMYGTLGANPWSPDGKQLVFARMGDNGAMDLWKIDLETRKETRLTEGKAGSWRYSPCVSFDGGRIVYGRTEADKCTIETLPLAGGEPEVVTAVPAAYAFPAWSPDGSRILYGPMTGGIWMVDAHGGAPQQVLLLDSQASPVVSRDGRVLYDRSSHQTDLYVQDLKDNTQTRLTFHTTDNFGPDISPDGDHVAYASSRTGNGEIWVIDRVSGSERQLTTRPAEDWDPNWSPDGKQVAFSSDEGGVNRLWVVNADGSGLRKLGEERIAGRPRWAPDGSAVGVVASDGGTNALYLVNPKDGTRRKVLDRVEEFDWYRDAAHVLYAVEGASPEMRAANIETGQTVQLSTSVFRELRVAPDGSAVSFCSAQSHSDMNLFLLPLSPGGDAGLPRVAGAPRAVTAGRGEWHVHNGGWSPNSRQVIYTRDTDTGDIYELDGVF